MGFIINKNNIDEIRENVTTFFRCKDCPIAIKVNIVTALKTDADRPAINANIHNNKTIQKAFT